MFDVICKTSVTPMVMNGNQLCAKLIIGGERLNEYNKQKLIKLYDCIDKCKTDGSAHKRQCLVRDGILNIDIDLDNGYILCFINWLCAGQHKGLI